MLRDGLNVVFSDDDDESLLRLLATDITGAERIIQLTVLNGFCRLRFSIRLIMPLLFQASCNLKSELA